MKIEYIIYIYIIYLFVAGGQAIFHGLKMYMGKPPYTGTVPAFAKVFAFSRGILMIVLGIVFYILFTEKILEPLPIFLVGTAVAAFLLLLGYFGGHRSFRGAG